MSNKFLSCIFLAWTAIILSSFTYMNITASYIYADGNGNSYRISSDSMEYIPVKKENSSSGIYSGGEPVKKAISPEQYEKVQTAIESIIADKSLHIKKRVKGSGMIVVSKDEMKDRMILFKPSAKMEALEKTLKEILMH